MPQTHSPGKANNTVDLLSSNFAGIIVSLWITWAWAEVLMKKRRNAYKFWPQTWWEGH